MKSKVKSKETDLLSVLAHNVKSPVKYMQFITDYTLRNWSEMNQEDLLDCATVINESARDITELLDNLIYWAELAEGRMEPVLSNFDLHNWIKEEVKLHRPILKIKSLSVVYKIDDDLRVNSDPNLLSLALQNVLTNAFKFSKKGDVITITAIKEDDRFTLSVSDEGVGISPDEMDKLNDDKLYSSLGTYSEKGTGLGTRIAKEIVGLLGGQLTISSQIDAGTKVSFVLPNNN